VPFHDACASRNVSVAIIIINRYQSITVRRIIKPLLCYVFGPCGFVRIWMLSVQRHFKPAPRISWLVAGSPQN
jgi:hypothetical protein